ncbi:suppressor of tumorigenicity 14 [Caerostris extrusa]|uniref:Suppressor of tumorigenicity 14 n=1 Tax=Caerostris extrusa TaxID=172846 RepID=A0AAV4ML22_CAEEX|nr:suppressor of tumorigenicity 14 [Caerostris extrusa]
MEEFEVKEFFINPQYQAGDVLDYDIALVQLKKPIEFSALIRPICLPPAGGNDTCHGDSGGPLMQSQLGDDGYIYWTQVGIISWGIGCGLSNTYGYYTHVQKLMEWITNTINSVQD